MRTDHARKVARVEIRVEFADGEIDIFAATDGDIEVDVITGYTDHAPRPPVRDPKTTVTVKGIENQV